MSLEGKATADTVLRGRINSLDVLTIDAYGVAVRNGFEGTEAEWLASLKGDTGTIVVDDALDENSTNPVQSKVIADRFKVVDEAIEELKKNDGGGGGGITITDDGNGNVEIVAFGGMSITDDGNGNVVMM